VLNQCKCGRYTNYGLTCTSCRSDYLGYKHSVDDAEPEESEEETEELVEEEDNEDSDSGV